MLRLEDFMEIQKLHHDGLSVSLTFQLLGLACLFECQHAVCLCPQLGSIWRRGRTEVRRIGFQEGLHLGWSLLSLQGGKIWEGIELKLE